MSISLCLFPIRLVILVFTNSAPTNWLTPRKSFIAIIVVRVKGKLDEIYAFTPNWHSFIDNNSRSIYALITCRCGSKVEIVIRRKMYIYLDAAFRRLGKYSRMLLNLIVGTDMEDEDDLYAAMQSFDSHSISYDRWILNYRDDKLQCIVLASLRLLRWRCSFKICMHLINLQH